jgi:replicative DNA helicase
LVRNAKGINYYDKQVLANLTEEELHSLKAFANALLKRLHMFARFGTCKIDEIEDKLHELVAAGLAPSLLVIDHVLAIADEGTPEELEQIAKQLKALAERQSIPIIALCHVRKQLQSNKRTIYRPQLSDIYNNSGLARYADVVLGVALDPQKRITYVETIKLERMSGGYADVMLKLVDWSLQEVEDDAPSSPSYAEAIEASDSDDVDVEELF